MQRFLPTTLLILLLCSCAPAPPSARLDPARHAVARAYAVGAPDLAPEDYRRARAKLEEGSRLNSEGESRKADLVLKQAIFFARRASEASRAAWKTADRQEAKSESEDTNKSSSESFRKTVSREKAESAAKPQAESQSFPESPRPEEIAPAAPQHQTRPDSDPPLPREYVVRDGETLWSIAARRVVYRDALLWPLIYRANRDQIKDPRQIFPQQVLTIPRSVSDEEKEAAREKARRSEIFPVEVLLRQIVEEGK